MSKRNLVENYLTSIQNEGLLFTAAITAGMINSIMNVYKENLSKKAKACSNYAGSDKTICNLTVDIKELQKTISALSSKMGKCDNDACKDKIMGKINKLKEKVDVRSNQIREVKSFYKSKK